jgi:tRNA pseudouridine55 synthase
LLIDKPSGWTSHDVVARVRRLAGQKRVGHTGTLDPMATGLMAVLLGAATRLEPYLTKMDKSYTGRVELGLSTDSDDITGNETARAQGPWPEPAALVQALKKREGQGAQIPPAYSAISVGGQRAYKAARAGNHIELAARQVTAHSLEMTAYSPPYFDFRAEVSSGYYIRSLARDLGADLALGGTLAALRRESVGNWQVTQAVTLEALAGWSDADWRSNLLPPAAALPHLPGLILDSPQAKAFCQGKPIEVNNTELNNILDKNPIKVLNAEGLLLGLANIVQASIGGAESPRRPFLRPLRVLLNGSE